MKVLHVLDRLDRGGTEMLVLDILNFSYKKDLDVYVVAMGNGVLLDEFRKNNSKFFLIQRQYPIDIFAIFKLIKLIRKEKIDVVHCHITTVSLHVYLASFFIKIKLVQSFHGYLESAKKYNRISQFLINQFNANIAVSKGFLKRLKDQSKFNTMKNFHIVYNGVDVLKFNNISVVQREEFKIKENDILFGMVGNFMTWKDQITICKALPYIISKYPYFKFVFVGAQSKQEPYLYENCVNFCINNNISDNVLFLGQRTDVIKILFTLDGFVFSTVEDTFGLALVEAMMVGLPTIVSDIPPLLEISDNGKYSKIFKLFDHEDLQSKIEELIINVEKRQELGAMGQNWVLSKFTIEKHIQELNKLYQSLF